jgi:hypothetical protein
VNRPQVTPLRILSLGAGVQSSTVLLMSLAGELPHLDAAIFADTGWEPAAVYAHLERLEAAAAEHGLPVYRVGKGNIRNDTLAKGADGFVDVPAFTPDGGMGKRQCTRAYKIRPIRRQVRALHLAAGRRPVEQWVGISFDERLRQKPSGVQYVTNRYPLVEAGVTRWDCQRWLARHGWTAPRSACIGCPLHSDADWRALSPEEFADAAAWEAALPGEQYLHNSLRPLPLVDLSTEEDRGQLNLFVNECEGMCGV